MIAKRMSFPYSMFTRSHRPEISTRKHAPGGVWGRFERRVLRVPGTVDYQSPDEPEAVICCIDVLTKQYPLGTRVMRPFAHNGTRDHRWKPANLARPEGVTQPGANSTTR
jgi:hypothetical protein